MKMLYVKHAYTGSSVDSIEKIVHPVECIITPYNGCYPLTEQMAFGSPILSGRYAQNFFSIGAEAQEIQCQVLPPILLVSDILRYTISITYFDILSD